MLPVEPSSSMACVYWRAVICSLFTSSETRREDDNRRRVTNQLRHPRHGHLSPRDIHPLARERVVAHPSHADESVRRGDAVRAAAWRSGRAAGRTCRSRPVALQNGHRRGVLRPAVRLAARRRAALHAADEFDGEVGRSTRGTQLPAGLSAACPGREQTSAWRADRTSRPHQATAAVLGQTERGVSQPQHLRPVSRWAHLH